jgi:hypothetical protein
MIMPSGMMCAAMSETDLHIYVDQAAKGLQEMSDRARNILGPPKTGLSPYRVLLVLSAPPVGALHVTN